jgi:transcriptional regulator with XRE-family HTH domain
MPKKRTQIPLTARAMRYHRERAGLSQRELGEKVGVSGSMIGQIERGDKYASYDLATMMARALGMLGAEDFNQPFPHGQGGEK